MAKLGQAMATGRTGQAPEASQPGADKAEANGSAFHGTWVQPQRFKSLVGRGHPEFSSARQQVPAPLQLCNSSMFGGSDAICQDWAHAGALWRAKGRGGWSW